MLKNKINLKISELIAIIIIVISACNFCFLMYHGVMATLLNLPFDGGITYATEEERIAHAKSPQEIEQEIKDKQLRAQHHEEIFEKVKPISTGIGIVCLIALVPLLIIGIIKKTNVVINIFVVLSILSNLLLIFDKFK